MHSQSLKSVVSGKGADSAQLRDLREGPEDLVVEGLSEPLSSASLLVVIVTAVRMFAIDERPCSAAGLLMFEPTWLRNVAVVVAATAVATVVVAVLLRNEHCFCFIAKRARLPTGLLKSGRRREG